MSSKPKTVDDYIKQAAPEAQEKLRTMRACLRKAAPGAEESIKWSMPAHSRHRILFTYAAFKHHIGFFPTPQAVKKFTKELSSFKTGKGSIQFPLDKPLPQSLIRKIAVFRDKEVKENDAKWM